MLTRFWHFRRHSEPSLRGSGVHRNSSPGAYGAYPFVDFDDQYFGIVARQGGLHTYPEGVHIFRSVQPLVSRWAKKDCGTI